MTSSREFEALLAAALDAVFVVDDDRVVIGVNPAACRLLGLAPGALVGRRFEEFLDRPDNIDQAWQVFLTTGQQTGPLRIVRAGGVIRDVEYSATAHFVPGRHLAILRDVTERNEAEAARDALLRRETLRLRESETLLAVSRTLGATLDPTETMRLVAREIAHALEADMVGAYLADPAHEALWPVAGYRVPKEMLAEFQRFPIPIRNHPAIEEAWLHGHAVWTSDVENDARVHRESVWRFPHRSNLFTPICIKKTAVGGFFVIWWRDRRSFTPEELRLLKGIADLAGIFLENAQLYRETAGASRAKDEFLATLSHELRNPLATITNAVAVLEQRPGRDDADVRLHDMIRRQTRHLTHLVDDLLDVARVTAGKVMLHRESVDLGDVVESAVRALRHGGRPREHRLTVRTMAAVVSGDPTRLEQIASNLLDNALKYTPVGGAVDVEVFRDGPDAVLQVTDSGVGIAPEMLPRIFDLFTQVDQQLERSPEGLGIGLTVTRRLVELHGGTVQALSEGPGRGARFVVRLPLATDASDIAAPAAPPRPGRRTILVVEDNDDARHSLRLLLESLGHQVLEAADGRVGLALALESRPDLLLIDLGLPGMDGYEVARAVRASDAGKSARLVAVTGYGQAGDRRRSAEAGFDAHIVKPLSTAALASLLAIY